MLEKYNLILPGKVYSGKDSLENIEKILKENDVKKLAVFTDKVIESTGLLDQAMAYVNKTGVDYKIINDLKPEPSYTMVQNLIDQCREYGADFILGIGGGSVLDSAKLASLLMTDEYGVKELLDDPGRAKKCLKTLLIPTTAGTGSEATINAIVAVPERELKIGIVNANMIPDYVILDSILLHKLPRGIAAATGVDALAHAIECFTGNKANPLSDTFALGALKMIIDNIEAACDDPDNMAAKTQMQIAAFYAGVAITASGTTAVHALSYPLGGKYHIAHGVSNAMLLVPVMRFNEPAIRPLLAKAYDMCALGDAKTEAEKSSAMVDRMGDIVKHLDIPTSLTSFGVPKEDLDTLVASAMEVTRLLNNNMRKVTPEDARAIYSQLL